MKYLTIVLCVFLGACESSDSLHLEEVEYCNRVILGVHSDYKGVYNYWCDQEKVEYEW